tara:strand:- start:14900 stop:15259 length:360 start_codon:yes stop_codon:yes gene_type:complete
MKPMKVEAGKFAPDVDELVAKAEELIVKVDKETKDFGTESADLFANVTGSEPVRTGYYDTNQRRITVEDVKRTDPKKEEIKLDSMQHSSHDNALEAHENKAGDPSDKNPQGAYNLTDYS